MDLDVSEELFSGTIEAKGSVVLAGKRCVSTFSAQLSGDRQGGKLVKDIARYVGPQPFAGSWHEARLGEMKLEQHHGKVTGRFSSGGSLEGTVTGPVLDLRWENAAGAAGGGFLSAASDGFLVGMIWKNAKSPAPQPVVAVQVIPTGKTGDKTSDIPAPTNQAQAMELKNLGYDLAAVGKHEEAIKILLKVVTYFQDQAKASTKDPAAEGRYLVNQMVPLSTLITSAFEAGDYPTLVKSLGMALDIQRQMGEGSADKRLFREQAGKYIAQLQEHAERMHNLSAAFDRGLKALSSSGVGFNFKEAPGLSAFIIAGVTPNMPASRAGVLAGDVLVSIDGISVAGMSLEQAAIRLKGEAGTSVALGLIRDGQPLTLTLVRAPLVRVASERRAKLSQALTAIRDLAAHTGDDIQAEIATLKRQAGDTEAIPSISSAFADLDAHIKSRLTKLEEVHPTTIKLAQESFAGSPAALGLFQEFVELQNETIKERKMNVERMSKLDQKVDQFERNPDALDMDKSLLRLSIIYTGDLDNMRIALHDRLGMVGKASQYAAKVSPPAQMAKNLAALAQWLDNWRSMMATDAAKIDSLQFGQDFYKNYVRILFELNLPEQALQASESARARAFADLLAANRQMRGKLNRRFESEGVLPNPITAPPLSLKEIKDAARARGGTLVEYFLLDDSIAIWVLNPQGESCHRSGCRWIPKSWKRISNGSISFWGKEVSPVKMAPRNGPRPPVFCAGLMKN